MNFRYRLLLSLAGLVLAAQFATAVAVGLRAGADLEEHARRELEAAAQLYRAAEQSRAAQLAAGVRVLAGDFGLKEAIATGDQPTIESAITNHARRARAGVGLVVDLDGAVLAASLPLDAAAVRAVLGEAVLQAEEQGGYSGNVLLAGRAYQMVLAPVLAPEPIAWVAVGLPLDGAAAAALARQLGAEVAIVAASGARVAVASTLAGPVEAALGARAAALPAGAQRFAAGGESWLGVALAQPAAGGTLHVLLLRSWDELHAPARELQRSVVLIAALALLLASLAAWWLAASASRPVDALAAGARRMERGDYSRPVEVAASGEFGRLVRTFNSMQAGIADREAQIRFQATHDGLTGLPNRALAQQRLERLLEEPGAGPVALVLVEFVDFDRVTASLGFAVGDEIVAEVAERLRHKAVAGEHVARVGFAQFLVVRPGTAATEAVELARYLVDVVQVGAQVAGVRVALRAAAGVCLFPQHGRQALDLMHRVETALYDAKQAQQPTCLFQDGRDDGYRRQLALLADLGTAIERGGLSLAFQPKVDLRTRRLHSVEVLVRWVHPTYGFVSPAEFIPIAERAGTITALTRWVLREALLQCRRWRDAGCEIGVAVNVAAADLLDAGFAERVLRELEAAGVPGRLLMLEVTEGTAMQEVREVLAVMERLRGAGVRFAIDDFGTGFSSLAQIKRLPVDELKIDKGFVLELAPGSDDETIVRTTIDLGHSLGLKVVAEGIENETGWNVLAALGCDLGQGYYMGKPMPAPALLDWLAQWQARQAAAAA